MKVPSITKSLSNVALVIAISVTAVGQKAALLKVTALERKTSSAVNARALSAQPAGYPTLPQAWVDNNECTDGLTLTPPENTLDLDAQNRSFTGPASTSLISQCELITTHLSPTCTGSGCYGNPLTAAGLQSAINDVEACRSNSPNLSYGFYVQIPPQTYAYSNGTGLLVPQTAESANASSCIVLQSTQDSKLPLGQTVGSHGIQDNLANSTDVGLNNPDGTGQNMYYALGASMSGNTGNADGTISGITTLSVNTTTLAAISSTGSNCVPLANGYVSPGVALTVDSGSNAETVTTTSATNQTGCVAPSARPTLTMCL